MHLRLLRVEMAIRTMSSDACAGRETLERLHDMHFATKAPNLCHAVGSSGAQEELFMEKKLRQVIAQCSAGMRKLFSTLRVSLQNWRSYAPWLIAGLLICGISWGVLLAALENERRRAVRDGIVEAATLSRGYADQVARSLDAVDQSLLHVRYEWGLSKGTLKLEEMAEQGLFPPPTTSYLAIADREGNVRTSHDTDARP